jgi:hypothetical protein
MTTSKLLAAAVALSVAIATPALAQWQTQEPASFAAQYPNGDPTLGNGNVRGAMAFAPALPTPPRHMTMHVGRRK